MKFTVTQRKHSLWRRWNQKKPEMSGSCREGSCSSGRPVHQSLTAAVVFSLQMKCCGLLNGQSDWQQVPASCRCNATEPECPSTKIYSTVRAQLQRQLWAWCGCFQTAVGSSHFNMSWSRPAALLHQDRPVDGEKLGGGAGNRLRHRHPAGQHTHTHTH